MLLFLSIIAICFLLTIATDIIKFLRISALFVRGYSKPSNRLQFELQKAEAEYELSKYKYELLKSDPSVGFYGDSIRCSRAEQNVIIARGNIKKERMVTDLKRYSAELIMGYGFKTLLYLSLVVISIKNRYNPVLILDEEISLQPLRGLLSFPTGVPNAISVPIWILSCNVTFGLFAGLIKEKKKVQ